MAQATGKVKVYGPTPDGPPELPPQGGGGRWGSSLPAPRMPNGPSVGGIGGGMTGVRIPTGNGARIGVGAGSGAVGGRGPIGGVGMTAKFKKGGKVGKMTPAEAVHKHERSMHKGKPLTKFAKGGSASKRADGIATKGKTKGRFV